MYDTTDEDLKELAERLRRRAGWADELGSHGPTPGWFFHLAAVVRMLTDEDPVDYLTSEVIDGHGTILAATTDLLVYIEFTRNPAANEDHAAHLDEAIVLPWRSVRSLSLVELPQQDTHRIDPDLATYRLDLDGRDLAIPIGKDRSGDETREFAKLVRRKLAAR